MFEPIIVSQMLLVTYYRPTSYLEMTPASRFITKYEEEHWMSRLVYKTNWKSSGAEDPGDILNPILLV